MAEIKVKADSGGGTVSFKGPSSTTSNAAVQLTLPVNDGDANQVLTTNGSGVLSFAAPVIADDSITEAKLDIHAAPSGTDKYLAYTSNGMEWATVSAGNKLSNPVVAESATDITSNGNPAPEMEIVTATITPTAATSKILIHAIAHLKQDGGQYAWYRLHRGDFSDGGSTAIADTSSEPFFIGGSNQVRATFDMWHLDSPNTTSAVTYSLTFKAWNNSDVRANIGGKSFIMLVEDVA